MDFYKKNNKQATIKDIAREVGVTPKTVSNFINKSAPVNIETGKKIEEAIKDFNYRPNIAARRFRTGKTYVIGFAILLPLLNQPAFFQMQYEIQKRLAESKYSLDLILVDNKHQDKYSRSIDTRMMDGLIVGGLNKELFSFFKNIEIPKIYLNKINIKDRCNVTIDNYAAGKIAAEYLIKNNHKKIAILINKSDIIEDFNDRKKGFIEVLQKNDIEIKLELNPPLNVEKLPEWFEENINKIISSNITACFAATDFTALNLIYYLHSNKIRVPDDISVIGFDNISSSSISIPPLTTVGGYFEVMGSIVADSLIYRIESGRFKKRNILVEPKLIERKSVKRL